MKAAIVDTGVWYAMFSKRDPYHPQAKINEEYFSIFTIVLPWPIIYETLRSKFVKNFDALKLFENFLKKPNLEFVEDNLFRKKAFELSLHSSLRLKRPLSMHDCLIRIMIEDKNLNIKGLFTFNDKDFLDVCTQNNVEIISIP
ncbi:MAG: hypothetical protein OEW87_10895 [Flavobacteriaceae bacterium]|nr:hypothetical protein [Flavobacteriaceae bacterium]